MSFSNFMRRGAILLAALATVAVCAAAPKDFTYQALITNAAGEPATTNDAQVDLNLFYTETGGTSVKTVQRPGLDLAATGGYVNIDIPSAGLDLSKDIYVEVTVKDGPNPPETLQPRQRLTSVPYALAADQLDTRTLMVRPGENIQAAYDKAKTMNRQYNNRVVVMLMPGQHILNAPLVMDSQAIDLVGFGNKSAAITGQADPLIDATATGGTGATIRNLIIQADGAANRSIAIRDGRIQDVIINPNGSTGDILTINATSNCSVKDFEIYGNVNIASYGTGTSFSNGFVTGTVTSNGSSASTEMLSFVNVSALGAVNFAPAGAFGILAISNVPQIGSIVYAPNTVIQIGSSAVGTPTAPGLLPDPAPGSLIANSIANAPWTGVVASSAGNVAGEFYSYQRK